MEHLPPHVCPDTQAATPQCVALITACYETQSTAICAMALGYCEIKVRQVYAKTNFSQYDYEKFVPFPDEEFKDPALIEFLSRPDVHQATGAHVSGFQHCNPDINDAFIASGDFLLDASPDLEYLLSQGIDTLLYAGERDVVCSWAGVYDMAMALNWPEAAKFRKTVAYPLIVNSRVKGVVRRHGSLALVRVLDAGHMSPVLGNPRVHVLEPTQQLKALLTIIRNRETSRGDFIFYSDRIIRLLVEEGKWLNHLPVVESVIETPTGSQYQGVDFLGKICGVSIMRAGESMEQGIRDCCRSVRIGKILIQRDEETAEAKLYYAKLPTDIATRYVLLLDPMLVSLSLRPAEDVLPRVAPITQSRLLTLITFRAYFTLLMSRPATGGSAIRAIQVLLDHGVQEERILFLNLLCAPEGIRAVMGQYPRMQIVTADIDDGLDEHKFITPGLGDFGCRYFGTDD
ncbi:hypothetical protein H4R34_001401 [Dimargaris verticillata]|uniref:uracil phosphoribosyltransferase n=1 Tax=Dimargaris verticillata TaxID=2761393 RepID=A0A9W8BBH5_9FUNG|nr:hypothetical protein H4R34_001401 [Dimargaris verticillata]